MVGGHAVAGQETLKYLKSFSEVSKSFPQFALKPPEREVILDLSVVSPK